MNTKEVLKKHALRVTSSREQVLTLFLSKNYALSHSDIEDKLGHILDRVTIYRTLSSFEEKGLIHKIYDDSGTIQYALCKSDCSEEAHEDNHIHFSCNVCNHIYCIESSIPTIAIPRNFIIDHLYVLIHGTCKYCVSSNA